MSRRQRQGFTLIEVLAAVFLTAVVMTVAIAFFVNLSDSTDAAAEKARQGRLALSVVDRIARDLEGSYLLAKPPDVDPLSHPWVFVAESHELDPGADRLRFVTRNHRPRNDLDHGSDLAMVTYLLAPGGNATGFDLLRAVSPGLADELDGDFPSADDERFMLVAEGIEHFALQFMGPDMEWVDDWDSSQLERSGQLPIAASIEIATLRPSEGEADTEAFENFGDTNSEENEATVYIRQVRLPMKPVNLAELLDEVDQEAAEQAEADLEDDAEVGPDDLEDLENLNPGAGAQLEPGGTP